MAGWQRKLDLMPEWQQCKATEISMNEMAGIIAERLSKLEPFNLSRIDDKCDSLVRKFRRLAKQGNLRVVTFDSTMKQLYDWGDTPLDDRWNGKKVCWIKTI